MVAAERAKQKAALLSLVTNTGMTALKVVAAVLTGSVSLFSEAAHSATDIIASGLAFASVRAAAAPPDEEHPYGHGKIESLAGFGEAVMLLLIVIYIVVESIHRISHPAPVEKLHFGLIVMGISGLASLLVGLSVQSSAKKYDSMALKSNGQHLMVDFVTSVGVFVALLITHLTGWSMADPVVALFLAGWIGLGAWKMSVEAFNQLIDQRIDDEDLARIEAILTKAEGMLSYHKLRTRHSGNVHYVDFHVVVPRDWSVVQAHDLVDEIELQIKTALSPCQVVIHVDPYDEAKANR